MHLFLAVSMDDVTQPASAHFYPSTHRSPHEIYDVTQPAESYGKTRPRPSTYALPLKNAQDLGQEDILTPIGNAYRRQTTRPQHDGHDNSTRGHARRNNHASSPRANKQHGDRGSAINHGYQAFTNQDLSDPTGTDADDESDEVYGRHEQGGGPDSEIGSSSEDDFEDVCAAHHP